MLHMLHGKKEPCPGRIAIEARVDEQQAMEGLSGSFEEKEEG